MVLHHVALLGITHEAVVKWQRGCAGKSQKASNIPEALCLTILAEVLN